MAPDGPRGLSDFFAVVRARLLQARGRRGKANHLGAAPARWLRRFGAGAGFVWFFQRAVVPVDRRLEIEHQRADSCPSDPLLRGRVLAARRYFDPVVRTQGTIPAESPSGIS